MKQKQKARLKIHSALKKTEKSDLKEGKSETNYTSGQVLDERERCVNFRDLRFFICFDL